MAAITAGAVVFAAFMLFDIARKLDRLIALLNDRNRGS